MRRVSSRAAGHTRAAIGLAQRAAPGDSVRFLSGEASYFVRQGHTHRLPQLLAYEFTRWAGFQVGRRFAPQLKFAPRPNTAVADSVGGKDATEHHGSSQRCESRHFLKVLDDKGHNAA